MKQLEVQIMGQNYLLGCPEGGDSRLLDAVERLDTAMCQIRDAGKVRARDRIAVLAALNLTFDLADQKAPALPTVATEPPLTAQESDKLRVLLERLDDALGQEGRLF